MVPISLKGCDASDHVVIGNIRIPGGLDWSDLFGDLPQPRLDRANPYGLRTRRSRPVRL